jgi:diguanylate cyclase (GGDEF)-like protein
MTASNEDRRHDLSDDPVILRREIDRLNEELAKSANQLAEMNRLAHKDPLVELPNRRSFLSSVQTALSEVRDHGAQAAVLFADMDGLKLINDQFGHRAGDQALMRVARVLVKSIRRNDIAARLGGDEFAILLCHTDELSAWRMALRVAEAVGESSVQVGRRVLPLSVAVGVAMIESGDTPHCVLSRAGDV